MYETTLKHYDDDGDLGIQIDYDERGLYQDDEDYDGYNVRISVYGESIVMQPDEFDEFVDKLVLFRQQISE